MLVSARVPDRADQAGAAARDADRDLRRPLPRRRAWRSAASISTARCTTSAQLNDEFDLPVLGEVPRIQPALSYKETTMSRIQNILDKAERDGAIRRRPDRRRRGADRAGVGDRRGIDAGDARRRAGVRPGAAAPIAGRAVRGDGVPAPAPIARVQRARLHPPLVAAIAPHRRRGRTVPRAAHAHRRTRDDRAAADVVLVTSPGRGEGKTRHRRQPGADDGAGVSAPRLHRRRRPARAAAARAVRARRRARACPTCCSGAAHARRGAGHHRGAPHRRVLPPAAAPRIPPSCSARPRCAGRSTRCASQFDRVILDTPPVDAARRRRHPGAARRRRRAGGPRRGDAKRRRSTTRWPRIDAEQARSASC